MFESETENFHKEMLIKLRELSPAAQTQLIKRVRKNREERTKQELKLIAENEQKLKDRFKHSHMIRYIEESYQYVPKFTLHINVKEKLQKCLHYRCFKTSNDETCVICTLQLKIRCEMVMLGCQHHYHIECIQNWFQNNVSCPICRDTLVKSTETEKIKQIEADIKQLNVSRAAIVNRNKNTNDLLQTVFLSKLKPEPLSI